MTAAMADMVPWVVKPPFTPSPPAGLFEQPTTLLVDATTTTLPFAPDTHFCAITGVRGALHEASFQITNSGNAWLLFFSNLATEEGRKPQFEVTCSAWANFYFQNGGSHTSGMGQGIVNVPLLNGLGYGSALSVAGVPYLTGIFGYLDEPQTEVRLTNPGNSGVGSLFVKDVFPLVSPSLTAGMFTTATTMPPSGLPMGGALSSGGPGAPSGLTAGFGYPGQDFTRLAFALPSNSFCFLTGLSGRYYSIADWAHVDASNGFNTLQVITPLARDRNPGIRVQCASFDHP